MWLPGTKFVPALVRGDAIPRTKLVEALRGALLDHRLTLLSAPAGYGKSSLLAALLHATPNLSLTWLSLDAEDNDPTRFLAGLVGALQHLKPAFGSSPRFNRAN